MQTINSSVTKLRDGGTNYNFLVLLLLLYAVATAAATAVASAAMFLFVACCGSFVTSASPSPL